MHTYGGAGGAACGCRRVVLPDLGIFYIKILVKINGTILVNNSEIHKPYLSLQKYRVRIMFENYNMPVDSSTFFIIVWIVTNIYAAPRLRKV